MYLTDDQRKSVAHLDKVLACGALKSDTAFQKFSEDEFASELKGKSGEENNPSGPLTLLCEYVIMLEQRVLVLENDCNKQANDLSTLANGIDDYLRTQAAAVQHNAIAAQNEAVSLQNEITRILGQRGKYI